jgi:asparagine synthetase B (glutamine-hydrolysing)
MDLKHVRHSWTIIWWNLWRPSLLRFKVNGRQTKKILRILSKDYLPEPIVQRQKQGFMFPIAYWFRGKLFPFLEESLNNSFFVRENISQRRGSTNAWLNTSAKR